MINYFKNFGFLQHKLPTNLYSNILLEASQLENSFISGISGEGVPEHFYLEKNNDILFTFLEPHVKEYVDTFGWPIRKYFTGDLPICYDTPWLNVHKKHQYFPNHSHNGVISYAIWLKLPDVETTFNFHYLDTIGNLRKHEINLTKEDEGSFVIFPSTIMHGVNPFYNTDDNRITMSGNISLKIKESNE
tara:strand:- start:85 stop:651 length:567 start_codon:yes stop_codon:yes gene_type:complete